MRDVLIVKPTGNFTKALLGNSHPLHTFYYDLVRLKRLYRQGWLRRGMVGETTESVAEHSFGVAILAMLAAPRYFPEIDPLKVLRLALLHDLGEIHAGDIVPSDGLSDTEKHALERAAILKTLSALPDRETWLSLWEEYEAGITPEAILARQLDRLEMGLQASVYEHETGKDLAEFFVSVAQALTSPELRTVLNSLEAARPTANRSAPLPGNTETHSPGRLVMLHDRAELHRFFTQVQEDQALYLYQIGDLDPHHWDQTSWYGWKQGDVLQAVLLLYTAFDPPVLIALAPESRLPALQSLLAASLPYLPPRLYVHITPAALPVLSGRIDDYTILADNFVASPAQKPISPTYVITHPVLHDRMILDQKFFTHSLPNIPNSQLPNYPSSTSPNPQSPISDYPIPLLPSHLPALQALYAHYPENSFDPHMLTIGPWFGVWLDAQLVSAAGLHVYSASGRVAALGNILTHPDFRSQGFAKQATVKLIMELLPQASIIGLNVRSDNEPAIRLYQSLGFTTVAQFYEGTATRGKG